MASKMTVPDRFGFDRAAAARWFGYVRTALWPYFRPQIIGSEYLPRSRAMVVGCHSGVLPYDAACTLVAIHEATGRFGRAIGDNLFGRIAFVEEFLRRQGAVVGRAETLEGLLRAGQIVLVFPGGALDMERPYLTQRYQVLPHRGFAPGRGGYIKIALRTRSPIVPLAVVGAEEAHVMLGNVPLLARAIGVPFFPLLLFPLPLPTKLYIRFGKPIALPGTPKDAEDQLKVDRLNVMVRQRVQSLIDDTVRRRRGIIFSTYEDGSPPARPSRPRRSRSRSARPAAVPPTPHR
jgi:1-acyl-sn-glycerol-3-phosphate acyltransferase